MIPIMEQIGPRRWILTASFRGVPAGFVTDLCSGRGKQDYHYAGAYVIHDWAYAVGIGPRKRADKRLLVELVALGMPHAQAMTEYRIVRWLGWIPWNMNRARRLLRPRWYMRTDLLEDL